MFKEYDEYVKTISSSILYSFVISTSHRFLRRRFAEISIYLSALILLVVFANLIVNFNLIQIVRISIGVHYVVIFIGLVLFAGNAFVV